MRSEFYVNEAITSVASSCTSAKKQQTQPRILALWIGIPLIRDCQPSRDVPRHVSTGSYFHPWLCASHMGD